MSYIFSTVLKFEHSDLSLWGSCCMQKQLLREERGVNG